ncbi:thiamine biosynthesis protein ThiS [Sphingomonas sp. UYAg733]
MTHTDGTVSIRVNGEHRRVAAGLTIARLAADLGLVPEKVAVERNLEIVPRSTLGQVMVEDGDELEIVHFVGGGGGGGGSGCVSRIVPNLYADDSAAGRAFFTEVLGLDLAMELDFISTYRAPGHEGAQISVITGDPSALKPDYSVGVDNVDECHDRAVAQGLDIAYPLTDEPWGVRRFFVRDTAGGLANIVEHRTS